jgi:hypothetical protein
VSTGLSLRALVAEQQKDTDNLDTDLIGSLLNDPLESNANIQVLSKILADGAESTSRVLVEYKPYTLRRRATEPSTIVVQDVEGLASFLAHIKAEIRCFAENIGATKESVIKGERMNG